MLIIDAHTVFWILLPPLLYEDSSSVDFYVLKRVLKGAIFLAVPCVVVHILVAGCCIRGLFASPNDSNPDGWPWFSCFTLASVLSATDPVAVVGALHSLNAPNKLVLLIAGESLFNDGSSVVFFQIFWDLAAGRKDLSILYFFQM